MFLSIASTSVHNVPSRFGFSSVQLCGGQESVQTALLELQPVPAMDMLCIRVWEPENPFSVAGQRFVVDILWFFQTFRRCDVKSWTNPSWIAWKITGRFLFWKQDKSLACHKKGGVSWENAEKNEPQKNSGDSVPLRDWRHVEFRDSFRCLTLRWFLVEIL